MEALQKFGQFIIANFRDKAIEQHDMLLGGKLMGAGIQELQSKLQCFTDDQKDIVRKVVVDAIDTAMHDLLFAIQDAHDRELGIEVLVDGENVAEISGMLNGEHLGEKGWIKKYSRYS